MGFVIRNNLNVWDYKDPCRWYRFDRKIKTFFRKIKWSWQRAKYGYCDMDLWNLDHTLGNYIASTVNELANRTHGHPITTTEEKWGEILRTIAQDFYFGVNEDCWENEFERFLTYETTYDKMDPDEKTNWDKWFKREAQTADIMAEHLQRGFDNLIEWYPHLWD